MIPGGAVNTARLDPKEVVTPMDRSDCIPSSPKKNPSRAERRERRLARGLSPYSPSDMRYWEKRAKPRAKAKYDQKRAFIDAIKLERGCADCGYNTHPAALQFDHLPRYEKKHSVAQMANNINMDALIAEIAKCEVVCANCHAVRTARRRNPDQV
jgi:hypothetical protein